MRLTVRIAWLKPSPRARSAAAEDGHLPDLESLQPPPVLAAAPVVACRDSGRAGVRARAWRRSLTQPLPPTSTTSCFSEAGFFPTSCISSGNTGLRHGRGRAAASAMKPAPPSMYKCLVALRPASGECERRDLAGKRERALTGRGFRTAVDRLLATALLIMVGVTVRAQAGPSPEEYV